MRSSRRFLDRRKMIAGFAIVAALLSAVPLTAEAETLYVRVRETKLRAAPAALGSIITTLKYGDSVSSLSRDGSWLEVRTGRHSGYVHQSALHEHRVVLGESKGPAGANSGRADVVIAGKGFNQEVERRYAAKQGNLNYRAVDAMERRRVSEATLRSFVREGKLLDER